MAALISVGGCIVVPGNFFLDTVVATTFIAHGFWGVDAIIGDYIPLIAPVFVAKVTLTGLYRNLILNRNKSAFVICEHSQKSRLELNTAIDL